MLSEQTKHRGQAQGTVTRQGPRASTKNSARPTSAPPQRPPPLDTEEKNALLIKKTQEKGLLAGPWVPAVLKSPHDTAPYSDLPPYWSPAIHGAPPETPKLRPSSTIGSTTQHGLQKSGHRSKVPKEHWTRQIQSKSKSTRGGGAPTAASAIQAARRSLVAQGGTVFERRSWIMQLPAGEQLRSLEASMDRDTHGPDFVPWTSTIDPRLSRVAWDADRSRTIRQGVQSLENIMRAHLARVVAAECQVAQSPCTTAHALLARAFRRVDPENTKCVDLRSFLLVWNSELQLAEEMKAEAFLPGGGAAPSDLAKCFRDPATGKLLRRKLLSPNAAAALFVKYGHDKQGLMPYQVFVDAMLCSPARLLGMEDVLDNRERGRNGLGNGDRDFGDRIFYPKCRKGVFPPVDFDPRNVERSSCPPKATMRLEHVYGYAGMKNLANNLFFICTGEVVYYTAAVGIVFDKAKLRAGEPCQRFFFGHDNDILCLNLSPNRRFVVSGQQVEVGGVPYVCVWDAAPPEDDGPKDTCRELQRLEHPQEMRGIVACAFSSGEVLPEGAGVPPMGHVRDPRGRLVVTVCGDNQHTVFVWEWALGHPLQKSSVIPAWYYGPATKAKLDFYPSWDEDINPEGDPEFQTERFRETLGGMAAAGVPPTNAKVPKRVASRPSAKDEPTGRPICAPVGSAPAYPGGGSAISSDKSFQLIGSFPGMQGAPPQVFGVVWNQFKPLRYVRNGEKLEMQVGEFATYGVNHVKTWNPVQGQWVGTMGSMGSDRVVNVLSAAFARRAAASRECVLLTGFPDGGLGVWVPDSPLPGCSYKLVKVLHAHEPGPPIHTADGKVTYSGVRALKLRADERTLLSGGGDGCIVTWDLSTVVDPRGMVRLCPLHAARGSDPNPAKGPRGRAKGPETAGPHRFQLAMPYREPAAAIRGLDSIPTLAATFIAGTNKCDVWEVDKDPEVLIFGHSGEVHALAAHPLQPELFVSASAAQRIFVWDAARRTMARTAPLTFKASAAGISLQPIPRTRKDRGEVIPGWKPSGGAAHHLAVGGMQGRVQIMDMDNLLPLKLLKDVSSGVQDLKYSPTHLNQPPLLAAASHDLVIDIYDVMAGYAHLSRCVGHGATVRHVDWSLPLPNPPELRNKLILQSNCSAYEILYWDPATGKQMKQNQRNASWNTWTCIMGFSVMGIWPDGSDGTDVNAVDRSSRGAPVWDPTHRMVRVPDKSPDAVRGAGFLVTADDYATIKLFNYPVVHDDAPFRAFKGHASHVMGVRFLSDDRRVVSCGGADRAIMQFRTHGIAPLNPGEVDFVPWCDVDGCDYCGRHKRQPPKPPPAWGLVKGPGGTEFYGPMA